MSLVSLLRSPLHSGLGYSSTAEEVTEGIDLSGRHFVVTGAASGLGRETTRVLLLRGATVWAAGRSEQRVRAGLAGITGDLRPLACDLADPRMVAEAVRVLGQRAPRLSGIVANAGIMGLPRFETIFGHEKQYMVNHVAHALLIKGLLERLSEVGRIVIVSSGAHRAAPSSGIDFHTLTTGEGYRPWQAYGRSKLANLLFARALSKRLPAGQTVNALHPGVIKTDLGRHLGPLGRLAWTAGAPLFFKSIEQGAATQCYLAAHPGVASISGRYFANCRERRSTRKGADLHLAERLFEHTMTLLGEFEGKTSLAL